MRSPERLLDETALFLHRSEAALPDAKRKLLEKIHRSSPIIAVTAKAMKADRDQCLEAGASDYINKPVDVNHLVSLMRVWLNRR